MPNNISDLEQQKLDLEIRRLKQDTGWRNLAIPAASLMFTSATILLGYLTYTADRQKSARDYVISCMVSATTVAGVITSATAQLDKLPDVKDKVNYAAKIMGPFSPQAAVMLGRILFNHLGDNGADALMLLDKVKQISLQSPGVPECPSMVNL